MLRSVVITVGHPILFPSSAWCPSVIRLCSTAAMQLGVVVDCLHKYAAPSLAGSWDNVGLLVEPSSPHNVQKLFLTNDLTEPVLAEALSHKVDMILSYHPPLFAPLKRLTQSSWKERIVVKCLENRIAVFSPHTSYDAVLGGVNDWLIAPFEGKISPIEPSLPSGGKSHKVELSIPDKEASQELKELQKICGITLTSKHEFELSGVPYTRVSFVCTSAGLNRVVTKLESNPSLAELADITALHKVPIPGHGPGRLVQLTTSVTLSDAVQRVKTHLGLSHVRLALAVGASLDSKVKTVAVCAGSGGSVLRGVKADLYITGEMSHHEVLDANHRNKSVILCDHSNTERGFLSQILKPKLQSLLEDKVEILVSQVDADPLSVV